MTEFGAVHKWGEAFSKVSNAPSQGAGPQRSQNF